MTTYLSRCYLPEILQTGKFVSVDFRKANGEFRTITGRVGVAKYVKSKEGRRSYDPLTSGNVIIWESTRSNRKDEKDAGYRAVKLARVITVRANKQTYTLVG